jgi:hypothetical protein
VLGVQSTLCLSVSLCLPLLSPNYRDTLSLQAPRPTQGPPAARTAGGTKKTLHKKSRLCPASPSQAKIANAHSLLLLFVRWRLTQSHFRSFCQHTPTLARLVFRSLLLSLSLSLQQQALALSFHSTFRGLSLLRNLPRSLLTRSFSPPSSSLLFAAFASSGLDRLRSLIRRNPPGGHD